MNTFVHFNDAMQWGSSRKNTHAVYFSEQLNKYIVVEEHEPVPTIEIGDRFYKDFTMVALA